MYHESDNCRIIIIDNIVHNVEWWKEAYEFFRPTDHFFVYHTWYLSEYLCKESAKVFDLFQFDRKQFFFLFNSMQESLNALKYNFEGGLVNHNCWLDESDNMKIIPDIDKKYDALYIARLSDFKRHHLAEQVPNLALIAGFNHGREEMSIPNHVYRNEDALSSPEVCEKINESRCGLILSQEEGACYSSSEYLLCGIPVISTESVGGRDVWYDSYNSLICDPTAESVSAAVKFMNTRTIDPQKIRNDHIEKAIPMRTRFIDECQRIFTLRGENIDAHKYYKDNYLYKLRPSINKKKVIAMIKGEDDVL
jgi:glycosyltransferase involved in cell wall biosynthesis